MKRFDVYVLGLFLRAALLAVFASVGLYLVVELIERWRWLERVQDGPAGVTAFVLWRIPVALAHVLPMATLLAALLTGVGLLRRRELLALRCMGLSPARGLLGILLGAGVLGLLQVATTELLMPVGLAQLEARRLLPPSSRAGESSAMGWQFYRRSAYRWVPLRDNSADGSLEFLQWDSAGSLDVHLRAEQARWQWESAPAGHWQLNRVHCWSLEPGGQPLFSRLETLVLNLPPPRPPADLRVELAVGRPLKSLQASLELSSLLQLSPIQGEGGGQQRALRAGLHLKGILPWTCVALVLWGVPSLMKLGIERRLLEGIGVGLGWGILLHLSLAAGVLALQEGLSPGWTLWCPMALWIGVGTWRWLRLGGASPGSVSIF